ncbi:M20 family metallopeptidase [Terribacillus sp. JSM ZJ617]|uniref:M20 metallopeptidase family protein n=1 Tax=Terribacillus sp. JSM ZJ617 TaxID=3342119 RepID=UPI0035A990D6
MERNEIVLEANDLHKQHLLNWRRHLHANPELSFQEERTSQFVYDTLAGFGNLELSRPTKTSVMAKLKGAKPGKVIGFRADMDALPIQEETNLPFASKVDGVMHACGHDAHTSILLTAAEILSAKQEEMSGEIRFFFQHAEELFPGGAKEMVEAGVTEGLDMVFGLHVASQLPRGKVGVIYGPATSNSDQFHLTVKGKGGHSSQPDKTVDPIVISAQIITNLQSVVSRMTSPKEELVVSLTTLQAGDAVNVIPNEVHMGASLRSLKQDVRKNAITAIERMVKGITEANGAAYELEVTYGYDSVINEEEATAIAERALKRKLGEGAVLHGSAIMGGEDFAAFANAVPGCFVFVGAKEEANPTPAPHHHPQFRIEEEAMQDGVQYFLGIAEDLVF